MKVPLPSLLVLSVLGSCCSTPPDWDDGPSWDQEIELDGREQANVPVYELVDDVQIGVPEPVVALVVPAG